MYVHQKGTLDEKLERMAKLFCIFFSLSVVAFKVYDLDGNGFVERHELLKLAETIHKFVDLSQQHAPKQGSVCVLVAWLTS